MSDFKGTPGPWAIDDCGDVFAESGRSDGQLGIVAGVAGAEWCSEDGANANLIAAAPELLEALQLIIKDLRIRAKIRGDIDDDGTVVLDIGSGALMKADEAIAKALGQ